LLLLAGPDIFIGLLFWEVAMTDLAELFRAGSLFINAGVGAGGVLQIVAPTVNTKGIWIRTCGLQATASGVVWLYANSVPPATADDTSARAIFAAGFPGSATEPFSMPYPLFVPPGQGIWIGSTGGGGIIMTWDVLS
jgi:hypothetical protein